MKLGMSILEQNKFESTLHEAINDMITDTFNSIMSSADQGTNQYKTIRDNHFKQIKAEEKRKQELFEKKMLEKKLKEIEAIRKTKLNAIKNRMDICESKELDTTGI